MSQDVKDRITRIIGGFDRRVQAAPAGSWTSPSPCDEWTATDVVAHVAGNAERTAAGLTGVEPTAFDPSNPVGSWNAARDHFLAALGTADLSQNVNGPMGPMPAEQMIGRLMSMDMLVHTWDLARAVGGDESLDEADVANAYSGVKPLDAMIRRPGVFGPRIDAPEGSSVQTEFLCFLGRTV